MDENSYKVQCFNPFKLKYHSIRDRKRLRHITAAQLKKLNKDETLVNLLICDNCRIKISKLSLKMDNNTEVPSTSKQKGTHTVQPQEEIANSSESKIETMLVSSLPSIPDFPEYKEESSSPNLETEEAVNLLNKSLILLQESPIKKRKLLQETYPAKKYAKICYTLREKMFSIKDKKLEDDRNRNIITQLKEEFHKTSDNNLKIRILTLFSDWTFSEILTHFKASKHMITVAKKVKEEKGILSCPNLKRGKRLSDALVEKILQFYESDDISRIMPGKKDYVIIYENGQKIHKQKRLVLCNLKEAFTEFKKQFSDEKLGFSKFAELRPKYCILAGASGTHTVCVCAIHQNVKLMLDGGKIEKLSQSMTKPIRTYRDCLDQIICKNVTADCNLNRCKKCPGTTDLINSLQSVYDEEFTDTIVYKQWVTVDRATLETMQTSVPDFLEKLSSVLPKLLSHNFIAQQQSNFLKHKKENLTNEECIVTGDFSENYAFVFQDAIQGVHWNNDQATIHPFVIYYKEESTLKHKSLAAISDCLKHDTVAVHLFQRQVIEIIKNITNDVKKIIYFSDGAGAQYKNKKNFINLSHHYDDFGLTAEWHFFATSHGKGPCDGIGGTIKRLAARYSLQHSDEIIKTPRDLFNWAKINTPNIECLYFDKAEYNNYFNFLKPRFDCAVPITGTKKFHSFIPIDKKQIEVREFSFSSKCSIVNVMK